MSSTQIAHRLFSVALVFLLVVPVSAQQALQKGEQVGTDPIIEKLVKFSETMVVIKDGAKFKRRGKKFFTDIGILDIGNHILKSDLFDLDGSIAIYQSDDRKEIVSKFKLLPGVTPDELALDPKENPDAEKRKAKPDWSSPIPASAPRLRDYSIFFPYSAKGLGVIRDRKFLFADSEKTLEAFAKAPPLKPHLSAQMIQLVNESGGLVFRWNDGKLDFLPLGPKDISEGETEFYESLSALLKNHDCAAMGMTYEHKRTRLNAMATLKSGPWRDRLLDADAVSRGFAPTLGLPAKQLVGSISVQSSCFKSASAMPYLTSHLTYSDFRYDWLQPMLRRTSSVLGGMHDETEGVRIGFYENADMKKLKSSHSIIGIIDSKDPERFIKKFEELVGLTADIAKGEDRSERNAEIEKLIGQLGSRLFKERENATQRLRTIGEPSVPLLEKAANDSSSAEQRVRIHQLLVEFKGETVDPNDRKRIKELKAEFNPEFSIAKTKDFDGMPCWMLTASRSEKMSPKVWAETSTLVARILGENWNQIRFVQAGSRFVFLQGNDTSRLSRAIQLVQKKGDPLKEQDEKNHIDLRDGWFQLRVSSGYAYRLTRKNFAAIKDKDLSLDQQSVGSVRFIESEINASIFLPAKELKWWLYGFSNL